MPSSVVTCDQKVDVEPPSLRGGEGVELLQEQASLLGLGDRCSPHDMPAQTVTACYLKTNGGPEFQVYPLAVLLTDVNPSQSVMRLINLFPLRC